MKLFDQNVRTVGVFELLWLAGRLAGWRDGWLAGRLAGRLAGWRAGERAGWLAGRVGGWQAGWPAGFKTPTVGAFLIKVCVL